MAVPFNIMKLSKSRYFNTLKFIFLKYIIKYTEDIQCFLMNIEFISRVRQDL
jgi:hypothetical protein